MVGHVIDLGYSGATGIDSDSGSGFEIVTEVVMVIDRDSDFEVEEVAHVHSIGIPVPEMDSTLDPVLVNVPGGAAADGGVAAVVAGDVDVAVVDAEHGGTLEECGIQPTWVKPTACFHFHYCFDRVAGGGAVEKRAKNPCVYRESSVQVVSIRFHSRGAYPHWQSQQPWLSYLDQMASVSWDGCWAFLGRSTRLPWLVVG